MLRNTKERKENQGKNAIERKRMHLLVVTMSISVSSFDMFENYNQQDSKHLSPRCRPGLQPPIFIQTQL